jgi:DNA-binding NtrC family response regulator
MVPNPSPRILLVDDERALLLSYQLIFERAGYNVTTADDTPTALMLLSQERFDLMLCDLSMERENSGLQVLDAAYKLAPGMPAVLMTGYSDESIPHEVAERGVNVVFKPIEIPRLLSTVDFLVRGKRLPLRRHA